MSINALLSIARTAITTHQVAMQTHGQNVANAETEGYSRQRVELSALTPVRFPMYSLGTGVGIDTVARSRDGLLDANYRLENERLGWSGARREAMSRVEGILGEPSETALSSQLDAFWGAWSDLANNPTSSAARTTVAQRGRTVAGMLNGMARRLGVERDAAISRLGDEVTTYNAAAKEIAVLNGRIVSAEVTGRPANDLRDARDRLVDQLSRAGATRVIEAPNGAISVYLAGATIVDGTDARALEVRRPSTGTVQLAVVGDANVLIPTGGALQANLEVAGRDIPAVLARLDEVAAGLVARVNAVHRTGWTATGDTRTGGGAWGTPPAPGEGSQVDFFDATTTSAATIRLDAALAADPSMVAAGNVQGATGNNAIAIEMASFRERTDAILRFGSTTETTSFADYWRATVTTVAVETSSATEQAASAETLVTLAETRRQSVSGVSIDEEMIQMMKIQQAYTAAAKVVSVADEMLQTLLALR